MKLLLPFLFIAVIVHSLSAETDYPFTSKGLRFPFFNEDGSLSHQIFAEKGFYGKGNPKLEAVEIHYYANGNSEEVIRRITSEEAFYDKAAGKVYGNGVVKYHSSDCQANGLDFEVQLSKHLLIIKKHCHAEMEDLKLKSDAMHIQGSQSSSTQLAPEKLLALGNVECTNFENPSFPFEKAYTQRAEYDVSTQMIHMPQPVKLVTRGETVFIEKGIKIKLPES